MLFFKSVFIVSLLLSATYCRLSAQSKFINQLELADTSKIDPTSWQKEGNELKVGFGSTDIRYLRHQVPDIKLNNEIKLTAWRGERVNIQMVCWSNKNIFSIDIKPSELKVAGLRISSKEVKVNPVRYVLTDTFLDGCGYRKNDTIAYSLAPDMLDNPGTFSMAGKSTRPVWISISVPADATPAVYEGYIEIKSQGSFKKKLHYTLEVQNRVLPKPSEWQYHLDLWQHPWAVARTLSIKPWSPEHWAALRSTLTMLAEAGQKCITVSLIHEPWGGQTLDPYESMVEWRKTADGSWTYDFTLFDQYVAFAMSCGIKEQISCYSMIPWHNSFRYFDESANDYKTLIANPGSPEFEKHWRPFLLAFREHLKNKGWLDKTCIAMDERGLKEMLAMIKFVKATVPEIKIAFAGGYHPEIVDDVYDMCTFITPISDAAKLKERRESHLPTTFYVCCSKPEHPNNFTFSPYAENTLMGWYASAAGYNGFLRWAYNSWVKDPEQDSRFRTWPAGDTFIVYPGAKSSIRFERMREGIQDYEKIRILREAFEKEGSETSKLKLKSLNEMLKAFTLSNVTADKASLLVNQGKEVLNALSR